MNETIFLWYKFVNKQKNLGRTDTQSAPNEFTILSLLLHKRLSKYFSILIFSHLCFLCFVHCSAVRLKGKDKTIIKVNSQMEVNSNFPIELKYLYVAFNNLSLSIPQKTLQFITYFCNIVRFYIIIFPMCSVALGKRENIHSPMDI